MERCQLPVNAPEFPTKAPDVGGVLLRFRVQGPHRSLVVLTELLHGSALAEGRRLLCRKNDGSGPCLALLALEMACMPTAVDG